MSDEQAGLDTFGVEPAEQGVEPADVDVDLDSGSETDTHVHASDEPHTHLHDDVREVVVYVDGEVAFSYYRDAGDVDVLVDPSGPGDPPHHDPTGGEGK